jgi:hypothetical protein
MLFFGGFGSVLPYIVYLSLMWICILIGVRSQLKSIISFRNPQEIKIETATIIVQQDRVAHFFDVKIRKQKPAPVISMGLFLSFDFPPVENNFHPVMYHASLICAHIVDACGLRAPPRIDPS